MGNKLFDEVASLTGLPKDLISDELVAILGQIGTSPQAVTLDELRTAMSMYLQAVIEQEFAEEESAPGDA